jgi:response regulator RpfG family c-di-GMP phosphodiesterase
LGARLISRDHHDGLTYREKAYGGFVEEYAIEMGAVREEDLLRFLATHYRTQFVGTQKLSKAQVGRSVLDLVPLRQAEAHTVFPILFDDRSRTLSVVTPRPDDLEMIQEVRATAAVRDVKTFLARPAAVKACIQKWYRGDAHAFRALEASDFDTAREAAELYDPASRDDGTGADPHAGKPSGRFPTMDLGRSERVIDPDAPAVAPPPPPAPTPAPEASAAPRRETLGGGPALAALNVLVSLLESDRGDLRGHSSVVARHLRELADRLGVQPNETEAAVTAGYLHDLGKGSPYHLTALNVAEWEGHREAAAKRYETPIRLLEAVPLPPACRQAVRHMYERFDGQGLPDGLSGKEIPLGARMLAVADTLADLTHNPRNPFRRVLALPEAASVLERYRNSVFDGNLVDVVRLLAAGSDLKERLLTGAFRLLVVDPDADQSIALELRLISSGFDVKVARSAEAALRILTDAEIHLVLSEVELEPFDGFELLSRARAVPKAASVPFVFYSGRSASEDVSRAFQLGAADYVVKPSTTDLLVAKIRHSLDRKPTGGPPAGAGVSGSLSEMSLPDLVQILSQGRKTGRLRITGTNGRTGEIHFLEGQVADAVFGAHQAEEAFYAMLAVVEGSFAVDPAFKPQAVRIGGSAESLLLEGMRRIDEAGR